MCLLARLWSQSPFKRLSWYDRLQGDSGGTLGFPWSGAAASGMLRDTRALVTGRPVILEPVAMWYSEKIFEDFFIFLGKPDKRDLILKIAGNQTVLRYHWSPLDQKKRQNKTKKTKLNLEKMCVCVFSHTHWPQLKAPFYSILFETAICQFNTPIFSPVIPDEVREHLTRDQRPFLHPESLQTL